MKLHIDLKDPACEQDIPNITAGMGIFGVHILYVCLETTLFSNFQLRG